MAKVELFHLPGSPFSLQAKWMLNLCGVSVDKLHTHTAMLSEVPMRLKLGLRPWQAAFWRKITVPVLLVQEQEEANGAREGERRVLADSFDIAVWAAGRPLADHLELMPNEDEVQHWNTVSATLLCYFRAVLLEAAWKDPSIAASFAPGPLRGLPVVTDLVVRVGLMGFFRKYSKEGAENTEGKAMAALDEVRAALKRGGGQYLLNSKLSYADIVIAVAIDGLSTKPSLRKLSEERLRFAASSFGEMNSKYTDLMEWKDKIVERHFPAELR